MRPAFSFGKCVRAWARLSRAWPGGSGSGGSGSGGGRAGGGQPRPGPAASSGAALAQGGRRGGAMRWGRGGGGRGGGGGRWGRGGAMRWGRGGGGRGGRGGNWGGGRGGSWGGGGRRLAALGAVVATVAATSVAGGLPAAAAGPPEAVIVTASGLLSPAAAVLRAGGTVRGQYHIIHGVDALIPKPLEPVLAAQPGITVTPDSAVTVQSATGAPESTSSHTPSDVFLAETGATRLAAQGDTGQGVTVAVLDTGIDDLPDFAGRLAGGVDLTSGNHPYTDSYGHGTFVAGLIAGDGASSAGQYQGEAPGAKLVSIKVAGADGLTHLGTLISGLQWAVDNQSRYGIKVLNISLGFLPPRSTVLNPVDQAVEAAWNAGITVVAAAGNAGPFNGTILSPGDDPLVITAGAMDDMATASPGDDEMNDFSGVGPTSPDGWVKPDLVTSGRSVVSLAAPGSTIWNQYPSGRVGTASFAGSGTSFSAAITSGAAALVLASNPGLTPDQVKARLLGTATPGPAGNPFLDGHGALDAYAAATSGPVDLNQSVAGETPAWPGTSVSLAPTGQADTWNVNLWSGFAPAQLPSTGVTWDGLAWDGAAWNGTAWDGGTWNAWAWAGALWSSAAWNGSAWDGTAWPGSPWTGSAWPGSGTTSRAWNGS
jgi:serine protease AprX